jgi:hypothetical protein
MSQPLNIIIVEKNGTLKSLAIKDFKEEELFKKCGFKKSEDFIKQTEWNVKCSPPEEKESNRYIIQVFAKTEGRANGENKYDFPPPIDNKLFFGSCAIVAYLNTENGIILTNLSLPLWEKIYEKLFGGFEDLAATAIEDEEEEDELANVPKELKTKQGYLKDGFVVDSSDIESDEESYDSSEEPIPKPKGKKAKELKEVKEEEEEVIEELGSELSEDQYDYSDHE